MLFILAWPIQSPSSTFRGPASPFSPGFTSTTYSGTLTIDVTAGTVTVMDVSFQGLSPYNTINDSGPSSTSDWRITAVNADGVYTLGLRFTTGHTPGSLVGFTGGTIIGDGVTNPDQPAYEALNGSITAVVPAPLPDEGRH